MAHHLRRRSNGADGFTMFELALAIALIGIFVAFLLNRVLYYRELAEKVAMEQTVAVIRNSLQLQTASLIARGMSEELPSFTMQNPMDWLAKKPPNYLGEIYGLDGKTVVTGGWVFDKKNKNLVYLVHNTKHFLSGNHEPRQVIFRTSLIFGEHNSFRNNPTIESVVLEQVTTYSWFK